MKKIGILGQVKFIDESVKGDFEKYKTKLETKYAKKVHMFNKHRNRNTHNQTAPKQNML